ncbi:hypothetical protein V8E51_005974 [Hyaloscypha variabilis]
MVNFGVHDYARDLADAIEEARIAENEAMAATTTEILIVAFLLIIIGVGVGWFIRGGTS